MSSYNDPRRVTDFAKQQANRARLRWGERLLNQRTEQTERLETNGKYVGYNAETERHEIKLNNGKRIEAESLTNSGQAKGDRVVISRGKGSTRFFKTIPRG